MQNGSRAEVDCGPIVADLLLKPRRRLLKVVEDIELVGDHTIRRNIHVDFDLRLDTNQAGDELRAQEYRTLPSDGTTLLLPVLLFPKGQDLPESIVQGPSGTSLTILDHDATNQFHSAVLRRLLDLALEDWSQGDPKREQTVEALASKVRQIAELDTEFATQRYKQLFQSDIGAELEAFLGMEALDGDFADGIEIIRSGGTGTGEDDDFPADLRALCKLFSKHLYQIVRVPAAGPEIRTITTSYQVAAKEYEVERDHLLGRVFEHRSSRFEVDTPLALSADSYLVRLQGLDGQYVGEQRLRVEVHDLDGNVRVGADVEGNPVGSTKNVASLRNTKSASLADSAKAYVVFFERPPGIQGMALFVAAVMTLLLASYYPILGELASNGGSVNFAEIILLAPAIAGAAIYHSLTALEVRSGSFAGRLALIATAIISLASAFVLAVAEVTTVSSSSVYVLPPTVAEDSVVTEAQIDQLLSVDAVQPEAVSSWITGTWIVLLFLQVGLLASTARRFYRAHQHFRRVCDMEIGSPKDPGRIAQPR